VLGKLNRILAELAPENREKNLDARKAWWEQIRGWQEEHPLVPEISGDEIKPQHLMAEIDRLSGGEAIVTTDVGQHQMWAAQFIRFNEPRLWLNSGGLGSMGFGLPSPSARSSPGPTNWSSRSSATAASRCPSPSWPPSPTTGCRSRSSS
jgi:acetolactate synthase I/II/III large subunit